MTSFLARIALIVFGVTGSVAAESRATADRIAIERTSAEILAAFAKGDLDTIAKYHHPRVEKALSSAKYLKGREAVVADLRGTLEAYALTFVEHRVESLEFFGDTCVEQTVFAIRGEPRGRAQPFVFRGRALVLYVRYPESPTGWASIREIIQPATE